MVYRGLQTANGGRNSARCPPSAERGSLELDRAPGDEIT